MRLMIWVRDQGITDDEYKDGDVFSVHPDTWNPGSTEQKYMLNIQVPDFGGNWEELISSEYATGPGNEPVVRRMRKYRLDYMSKLTPEELALVKDPSVEVPVMIDKFALTDIVRK